MQSSLSSRGREEPILIHEEVEKRYLAYALSTIVSRALPDVRDGLKPVHRRILYAMHSMGLGDAAKMRKSAAVVGEVIGKYHPHGDQAAYDALVRMAQDFSLRYPLIEGSGNFGSLDGDSPAAMRYTETRLSAFAATLLREIGQGTTAFNPTYDGMGEEPQVLPAAVPNLLLNGSSGIAVGMSCSFPPHNFSEVIAACRAAIRDRNIDTEGLLQYIKGPDFPTGGEIPEQPDAMRQIYSAGHGSIRLRGAFEVESRGRGGENLIITSIPYSVNKSRLIERIAGLVKDKKLRQVQDVRDESTDKVRIVLELKGGDVRPESIMAFLCKHTDVQINFPLNFIAISPQGVPERLGLAAIIRHFLQFRYERTVLRLQHTLALLEKRIHVLEGFEILFQDLDKALGIIRRARSRSEAEQGLTDAFSLDKSQVDAILEMRLYRLVSIEMGKLLDELAAKRREAAEISKDLASPERLWKIIDKELSDTDKRFGDPRRTNLVADREAAVLEFDPDEFVEHEDVSVILSTQGWIRRMKTEVEDLSSLKFREGDSLLALARTNTEKTVALFSNLGKVYVVRVIDIPATAGFGEPVGTLLNMGDGEFVVSFIAPDPAKTSGPGLAPGMESASRIEEVADDSRQTLLFARIGPAVEQPETPSTEEVKKAVVITRHGKGFRFDYEILREPSKRGGRKLVNLGPGDEVLTVKPETSQYLAVAASSGHLLVFPAESVPIMNGPAQGVRMIGLKAGSSIVSMEMVNMTDRLTVKPSTGKEKVIEIDQSSVANRATVGKKLCPGIVELTCPTKDQGQGR